VRILRSRLRGTPADLLAVPAVMVLATPVVWTAGSPWHPVAGGVVLLGPGYVLARVLAGTSWPVDAALAVALVGLAIAVVALTGLALDRLSAGLTADTWPVALDAVAAAVVAVGGPGTARLDAKLRRPRRPGMRAVGIVVCLILAAALAAAALSIGLSGARAQERRQPFVDLWLLPQTSGNVEIGLRSGRSEQTAYRIVLRDDHRVLRSWHGVSLAFAGRWHEVLSVPRSVHAGALLRAEVFAGHGTSSLESIRVRWPG
jgi:hypothetical protein